MATIVALGRPSSRDQLGRDFAAVGGVEWYDAASAAVERVRRGGVDVVLCGLEDEAGRSIIATVVALAAAAPAVPVILSARVNRATMHKWLAVVATGLRLEPVIEPYQRLEPVVRRVIEPGFRPGVSAVLLQQFVPDAPTTLQVFVALAALGAPMRHSVERIALWSGVTPRTIERRLRRARWPSARTVLQSFTALDAVWLMTEYGWSARRVQQVRRFPHESSVTRLLARYVGLRPATLREAGGFPEALAHVASIVTATAAD